MAEQLMPLSELVKELIVDEAIALDYCRDEKLGWLYDNEVFLRLEELSLLVDAFNNEEEKEGREPLLSYGDTELRQIWERVLEREKKRKAEEWIWKAMRLNEEGPCPLYAPEMDRLIAICRRLRVYQIAAKDWPLYDSPAAREREDQTGPPA